MQRIPAWHLAGARLRVSVLLRADGVEDSGALWVRVDGGGRSLFFDNMQGRALRGTTGWLLCRTELDVPAGAEWLNYGLLLSGNGALRASGLQIDVLSGGAPRPFSLWSPEDLGATLDDQRT
jgi:hypothetical protein